MYNICLSCIWWDEYIEFCFCPEQCVNAEEWKPVRKKKNKYNPQID